MHYVISDIHGNMRRFRSVMDQIGLQAEDTLFILGDVIDRHPYGLDILEEIMATPNMRMILGNHEYMLLNVMCGGHTPWPRQEFIQSVYLWHVNGGDITQDALMERPKEQQRKICDYLLSLPVFLDINVDGTAYKLVHAAPPEFYPKYGSWSYSSETEYAVWDRHFVFERLPDTYTMIFGHTPTRHFQAGSPLSIWHCPGPRAIGIDCGSGFPEWDEDDEPLGGRLACLRLEDMKEFYSEEAE